MKAHCTRCQKRISGPTIVKGEMPYCTPCIYFIEVLQPQEYLPVVRPA